MKAATLLHMYTAQTQYIPSIPHTHAFYTHTHTHTETNTQRFFALNVVFTPDISHHSDKHLSLSHTHTHTKWAQTIHTHMIWIWYLYVCVPQLSFQLTFYRLKKFTCQTDFVSSKIEHFICCFFVVLLPIVFYRNLFMIYKLNEEKCYMRLFFMCSLAHFSYCSWLTE